MAALSEPGPHGERNAVSGAGLQLATLFSMRRFWRPFGGAYLTIAHGYTYRWSKKYSSLPDCRVVTVLEERPEPDTSVVTEVSKDPGVPIFMASFLSVHHVMTMETPLSALHLITIEQGQ